MSPPRRAWSVVKRYALPAYAGLAILVVVAVYLRFAGTGAFMGEEDEAR